MIQINLFPVKQIKKRIKARNEILCFILMLAFLGLCLGGHSWSMTTTVNKISGQIKKLEKKKAENQHILKQIEELKQAKLNLETKLDVIKQLRMDSQVTVRVLDETADNTPANRIWLKSLQQSSGQLRISGVALDNATIAAYMKKMTDSPFFASADLKKSSQTVVEGQKLKSFSMTLVVTTPEPETEESDSGQGNNNSAGEQ